MFRGWKTYVVALLFVIYAVIGVVVGEVEMVEAGQLVLEGGGLAALRAGVASRLGIS